MKIRPVFPRTPVADDVNDTIEHFQDEGGAQATLRFIDAPEQAYGRIGRYPAAGSPRYVHELNLPGLRSRPPKCYPYVVLYVELRDHIDVWQVRTASATFFHGCATPRMAEIPTLSATATPSIPAVLLLGA